MPPRLRKLDVPVSILGEGPLWSERGQCFYFVDIVGHRVASYRPADGGHRQWQFDRFVGALAECESGGLLVSLKDRLVRFDPRAGVDAVTDFAVLEADRPHNRLNDGTVDPWGNFWVGSMQADEKARNGRLWRVSPDGSARCLRDGIGVSNSLAFDRRRGRVYFADSMNGIIEQADLDDAHLPRDWRPFAKAQAGAPDGSCVDADGCLWNAEWGGRRLTRYSPDGAVERVVDVPTSRPSCPAFGGPDYRTLFVTTANYNMSAAEKLQDPEAGAVYSLELDNVKGLPPNLFAL